MKIKLNETGVDQEVTQSKTAAQWAEEYKEANEAERKDPRKNTVNEFWDNYFNNAFSEKLKKIVTQIKSPLRIEITEYGFNKDANPFLEYIYSNEEMLTNIKNINIGYSVIHNAFVNNYLDAEDLLARSKQGSCNVIFCKDLFKYNAAEIENYIKYQYDILNKISYDVKEYSGVIRGTLKAADMSGAIINPEKLVNAILYSNVSIAKELKPIEVKSAYDSTLNSLANIKTITNQLFLVTNTAKVKKVTKDDADVIFEKFRARLTTVEICQILIDKLTNKLANQSNMTSAEIAQEVGHTPLGKISADIMGKEGQAVERSFIINKSYSDDTLKELISKAYDQLDKITKQGNNN